MRNKRQYLQANRIGVVGTGFLAKGLVIALEGKQDLVVSRVLTRTNILERTDFPRQDILTNSKVISFTDGTKIQFEQALVANGLGAGIATPGLLGIASEDVNIGARALAEQAKILGYPISDYILSPESPPGVFIVAEHDEESK